MMQVLRNKIDGLLRGKSLVLMYHRITSRETDIWDLAVSPDRFEQQLQVLLKKTKIVPLAQFFDTSFSFKPKVAITFDDGYLDNYLVAKPLLEKHSIPATFFLTSFGEGNQAAYWWDELEYLLLFAEKLPEVFRISICQKEVKFKLEDETYLTEKMRKVHMIWKAYKDDPPSRRSKLLYELWHRLQKVSYEEQQHYLEKIRIWANISQKEVEANQTISQDQLRRLSQNSLFTIGSHTASHPALGYHNAEFQKKEIYLNRRYLEETIKKQVNFLAYPYGNYNKDTLMIVKELGFDAAFTTHEASWQGCSAFETGRFQVRNLDGEAFESQLKTWLI